MDQLHILAELDEFDYLEDHAFEGRYLVQAAAQLCIDLANHLIASSGWAPAREFREAFARLGQHGVLATDLVTRLQAMVGLRNRLVHLYDEVDDALVRQAVVAGLPDIDDFARSYARHIVTP